MSLRAIIVIALPILVSLGACSQWPTPITTWEQGKGSGLTAGVMTVPGHLQLLQVDGRELPDYLVQSATFEYLLQPGERRLTVRYDSLWAGGLAGDARRVTSSSLQLQVEVAEGGRYRLVSAVKPATVSAADAFAACPELWLESAAGERLVQAQPEAACSATD